MIGSATRRLCVEPAVISEITRLGSPHPSAVAWNLVEKISALVGEVLITSVGQITHWLPSPEALSAASSGVKGTSWCGLRSTSVSVTRVGVARSA